MTTCSWFLSKPKRISHREIVIICANPLAASGSQYQSPDAIFCTWSNYFSKLLASFPREKIGRATSRDNLACGSTRVWANIASFPFFFSPFYFSFQDCHYPLERADRLTRRWCNQRNVSSIAHHLLPRYIQAYVPYILCCTIPQYVCTS